MKRGRQTENRIDNVKHVSSHYFHLYSSEHCYVIPQLLRKATEIIYLCKSKDKRLEARNIFSNNFKVQKWKGTRIG